MEFFVRVTSPQTLIANLFLQKRLALILHFLNYIIKIHSRDLFSGLEEKKNKRNRKRSGRSKGFAFNYDVLFAIIEFQAVNTDLTQNRIPKRKHKKNVNVRNSLI